MIEIKPGVELDKAVARAIGLPDWKSFRPSTDMNAAFAAAEKVELFWDCNLGFGHPDGRRVWVIDTFDDGVIAEASNPALAISAAILKMKENDDEAT